MRLGVLVPSSNTALEPITIKLIQALGDEAITVHFSRFSVTKISLEPDALNQFQFAPIIAAARLLADAKVDVIGWSGTSGGWLGFDNDDRLCEAITKETGIKVTTSVTALNKLLKLANVKTLGLVTPYTEDVQEAIRENYKRIGVTIDPENEVHLSITDNHEIAKISDDTLDRSVASVATNGVDAISTFCTNMTAAKRVDAWEQKHGIPVFDTVAVVVWDMLQILNYDASKLASPGSWGRMFTFKA